MTSRDGLVFHRWREALIRPGQNPQKWQNRSNYVWWGLVETQSEFAGKWKVADTAGTPFEITLGDDGSATANRSGEAMEGTWKEDNGAAIISWKDGWTTKIAKVGDGYAKTAWGSGLSTVDPPSNRSSAEKVN